MGLVTFLLLVLLPSAHLLRLHKAEQGEACGSCSEGLVCACLALNRGLRICAVPNFLTPPEDALSFERQGLSCEPRLPEGLQPVPRPPLVATERRLDPRQNPELASWARGPGQNFYTQYQLLFAPEDHLLGVPLLAGDDVSEEYFEKAARTLQHLLLEAAGREVLQSLAHAGVKILLAGPESDEDPWLRHPEVSRHFTTGLGGGSPWFPSTGVFEGEAAATLAEELFHTIQYCHLGPQAVCMYHKAYKYAMERHIYTTDNSAEEVDGEPVPTVQADEYMAMALMRWLGVNRGFSEYAIPGNTAERTGRQSLRDHDQNAFCILSTIFRADDSWNPEESLEPWRSFSNQGMDVKDVADFCTPVLAQLAEGCPNASLAWPARPRKIP
ncbi:unnamed protein product [Effrenium voratum]|uniref:DUF1570 domain-containing protein n=1 Tax=Effrenium voratum TaxID=2562239 RepID=A0AA36IK44_9DINO|nr:unnamed protein product [Effrenium voratum]CAJ1456585.1 unnamed protein product [Effrenium voratum]